MLNHLVKNQEFIECLSNEEVYIKEKIFMKPTLPINFNFQFFFTTKWSFWIHGWNKLLLACKITIFILISYNFLIYVGNLKVAWIDARMFRLFHFMKSKQTNKITHLWPIYNIMIYLFAKIFFFWEKCSAVFLRKPSLVFHL